MKKFHFIIWFIFLVFPIHHITSQSSCNQRFEQAQKAFYTGQLREVETLLTGCFEELDKIQKEQAIRLLTISKIYLKEMDKADSMMLLLLKLDPEYKTNETDPPEFKNLMNSYKRTPLFSIGILGGLNTGIFTLTQQYSISTDFSTVNYNGLLGWQIGIPIS